MTDSERELAYACPSCSAELRPAWVSNHDYTMRERARIRRIIETMPGHKWDRSKLINRNLLIAAIKEGTTNE